MLERIIYTLKQIKHYKKDLRTLINDPLYSVNQVFQIDLIQLKENGITTIVLDFDGVLAAHGEEKPLESIKVWLDELVSVFGEENIYILSNKPTEVRLNYFKAYFPKFTFISGVRKKPYPDGMLRVIVLSHKDPSEIVLIDDRLLTGCLASLIAKTQPIYVKKAFSNYKNKPMVESFFALLRKLDRWLV
ncbi:HAD family hydrolase [Thiotrichales bacterium 19S9-12]|nr:HAD family hydrolase [Thiotrichales bacterium 19S9-11]MCF6811922.1 HAD family hydrolase [Thiotrichales bacterium 19S9-12]